MTSGPPPRRAGAATWLRRSPRLRAIDARARQVVEVEDGDEGPGEGLGARQHLMPETEEVFHSVWRSRSSRLSRPWWAAQYFFGLCILSISCATSACLRTQ
jgi:hypothetical protein